MMEIIAQLIGFVFIWVVIMFVLLDVPLLEKLSNVLAKVKKKAEEERLSDYHYIKEIIEASGKALSKFGEYKTDDAGQQSFYHTLERLNKTAAVIEAYKEEPEVLSLINATIGNKDGEKIITALHAILADEEVTEAVMTERKHERQYAWVRVPYHSWYTVTKDGISYNKEFIGNKEIKSVVNDHLNDLNEKIDTLNAEIKRVIGNYKKMKKKEKEMKVHNALNQSWVFGEEQEDEREL